MTDIILKIYTYLKANRMTALLSFLLVTALLVMSVLRLNYKEDIEKAIMTDGNAAK